jgi:hypothetical protein
MTRKGERGHKFDRNPVAKHAHKFNRAERMTPERLKAKQGYRKHKSDWSKEN